MSARVVWRILAWVGLFSFPFPCNVLAFLAAAGLEAATPDA